VRVLGVRNGVWRLCMCVCVFVCVCPVLCVCLCVCVLCCAVCPVLCVCVCVCVCVLCCAVCPVLCLRNGFWRLCMCVCVADVPAVQTQARRGPCVLLLSTQKQRASNALTSVYAPWHSSEEQKKIGECPSPPPHTHIGERTHPPTQTHV